MASSSLTETLTVPVVLSGVTAVINWSLNFPTDYILKDLAISFGTSLADELTFNYLVDPYVLGGNQTATSFLDTLGKPVTYAVLAHLVRMFV